MNIICTIITWNIFGKIKIEISVPKKQGKEKIIKNKNIIDISTYTPVLDKSYKARITQ